MGWSQWQQWLWGQAQPDRKADVPGTGSQYGRRDHTHSQQLGLTCPSLGAKRTVQVHVHREVVENNTFTKEKGYNKSHRTGGCVPVVCFVLGGNVYKRRRYCFVMKR